MSQGIIQFLDSLKDRRCIDSVKHDSLKNEFTREGNLKLSSLLSIFPNLKWTEDFLFTLPVGVTNLLATYPTVSFRSSSSGWMEVSSITFKVTAPQNTHLRWSFTLRKSAEFLLSIRDVIQVSIAWPGYPTWRQIRGIYQGILQRGSKEKHFVGEYTMDSQRRPQNRITFADSSFNVENHTLSIRNVLEFLSFNDFGFSQKLRGIIISGLGSSLNSLNEDYALKNVGFVLMRIPHVFLDEIFGTFPLTKTSELLPNNTTSFRITSLRVLLQDLYSTSTRKLFLQLHGGIELGGTPCPFRLTSGPSRNFGLAIIPETTSSLSVQRAFDIVGCSLVGLPVVSNLTTSTGIHEATAGWIGGALDYLGLVLVVGDWTIVQDKFAVRDLSFEVSKRGIASGSKFLSFYGLGLVKISSIDLDVALEVTHNGSSSTVTFDLLTTGRAIQLKSILDHFLPGSDILPSNLTDILKQTAFDEFRLQGVRDKSNWVVSHLALVMSIQMKLDITGDKSISLADPRLKVDIWYPFGNGTRVIGVLIESTVRFGERTLLASIVFSKSNGRLRCFLALHLQGQNLSLWDVISLFVDPQNLLIPPTLAFLLGISLKEVTLTLGSTTTKGKFSLTKIEAIVVSPVEIGIWDGLALQDISLDFLYDRTGDPTLRKVDFGVNLSFGRPVKLLFTLSYLKGPSFSFSNSPPSAPPRKSVKATTDNGEEWLASASCTEPLSVLDALSHFAKINIRNELDQIGLTSLREVLDFKFSESKIVLTRKPNDTSFALDSKVKHAFFDGPLHLEGRLTGSWIYRANFGISASGLFSNLGVSGISMTRTYISFSNDPNSGRSIRHGKFAVEFAGTLELKGDYQPLVEITKTNTVNVAGAITNDSFSIYAATEELPLVEGMKLSGALAAVFARRSIKLAIIGAISDIYLPDISTSKFSTEFSLFVKIPKPQLGLSFSLDRLENAFGCKSLHFENLRFSAAFDSFPKPSELDIAIAVCFQIGSQQFAAQAELHYSQNELQHCCAWGMFTTFPSFNQAITGFDGKGRVLDRSGPESTNGSFSDLEFAISPSGPLRIKNRLVKQGYMFKGSLILPSIGVDASFHVEISTAQIMAKGDIKKAIVFPKNTAPRLFALYRDGDTNLGPYLELTIKEAFFICKVSSAVSFLGVTFATSLELSSIGLKYHNLVSVNLAVVKSSVDFYAIVAKSHLQLQTSCDFEISIPLGVFGLSNVKVVKFAAVFGASIDWGRPSFEFWVTGSVQALDLVRFEVATIAVRGDLSSLSQLAQEIGSKIGRFLSDIVGDKLKRGLQVALRFLKDLGLAAVDAGRFLINRFSEAVRAVVIQLKAVYDLAKDAIRDIAKSLSASFDDAVKIAEALGYGVVDFLKSLGFDVGKIIGDIVRSICVIA